MLIPLYVQGVLGRSVQSSGFLLAPLTAAFALGTIASGQLASQTGRYKLVGVISAAMFCGGFLVFSSLTPSSSLPEIIVGMILVGLGIGGVLPIFLMALQSSFAPNMLGTVYSARTLFSNLGAAVTVTVMTAAVTTAFTHEILSRTPASGRAVIARSHLTPQQLLTRDAQRRIRKEFVREPGGEERYRTFVKGYRSALGIGVADAFKIGTGLGAIALLLMLCFPRIALTSWESSHDAQTGTVSFVKR